MCRRGIDIACQLDLGFLSVLDLVFESKVFVRQSGTDTALNEEILGRTCESGPPARMLSFSAYLPG